MTQSCMTRAAIAAILIVSSAEWAVAQTTLPVEAFNNATVQPAGPRSGANGKNFLNVEGSNNGAFASFGVVDFNFGTLPQPAASITSVTLSLTQSNAAFTTDGPINFYFAPDTTTSIEPGSSLIYDTAFGEEGIGTQLGTLVPAGSGTFIEVSNGTVDTYTLTLDSAGEQFVRDGLNGGENLRLVITPTDPATAATWAGFSNTTFDGPILSVTFTPVPEPAGLLAVGALATVGVLRRRSTRHGATT